MEAGGRRLLRRRLLTSVTAEDVPTKDFRRGILDGDGGGTGRGAVAAVFSDERRRFGGITKDRGIRSCQLICDERDRMKSMCNVDIYKSYFIYLNKCPVNDIFTGVFEKLKSTLIGRRKAMESKL
jgi:hypothetical protein